MISASIEADMTTFMNIAGVVLIVAGSVWFLQGIDVIPGSFMTGQMRWAVYGGICIVGGVLLLFSATRAKPKDPDATQ